MTQARTTTSESQLAKVTSWLAAEAPLLVGIRETSGDQERAALATRPTDNRVQFEEPEITLSFPICGQLSTMDSCCWVLPRACAATPNMVHDVMRIARAWKATIDDLATGL